MSVLKGILKRYFPKAYYNRYSATAQTFGVQLDNDSLTFETLYLNSFTTTLIDEITIEERYKMNYKALNLCDLFISNKYLMEINVLGNDIIVLVDKFYNNKGDKYIMYTDADGKIYHVEYNIQGDKNLITFINLNGAVTVKDQKGYEKQFSSYYHNNVYECDNFLIRILELKRDCKNVILEGYKIFTEYSCYKHRGY